MRPAADAAPPTGRRVNASRHGRYVLGDLLGRGGMAEVFSGYVIGSHGFQKPVAIKRLLPELANDEVFVERLIDEAKLLVGMQHGNVVSVLDLARDGDDVFLVMEYVDGPSLRQLLKGRGKRLLPLGVASYIVQSAAAGLEFAHARPGGAIIHADISPSNLLLTTSGEVRVADFGIARREGGLVGVVEGKWAYMAPEQARGEVLTPRSDVFALGVVLYELITGQHPLGRQVSAEERDSGPIRVIPPRVVNPAVPPGLDAICMRALAENARDRYPRMQSMIDAIMDERFTNQWRDGANDLANAIREITPGAQPPAGPRTQVTDRPLTIVTRSLISQPQRMSSPVLAYESPSTSRTPTAPPDAETLDDNTGAPAGNVRVGDATGMITQPGTRASMPVMPQRLARGSSSPLVPPSGAQTLIMDMQAAEPVQLPPAMLPLPEQVRLSAAMLPHPELASVHGGSRAGAAMVDMRDARGGNRWTIAVLGVAAMLGIGAAIAIQLAPSPLAEAAATGSADVPASATEPAPTPAAPTPSEASVVTKAFTAAPTLARSVPTVRNEPTVPPAIEDQAATVDETATAVPEPKVARVAAPEPVKDTDSRPPRRAKSTASKRASAPAAEEDATLRVKTYGGVWARVDVDGKHSEIPDAKFKLAPGTYRVRLKNTDLAVQVRTCTVVLEPGQVRTLDVEMEEGACDLH